MIRTIGAQIGLLAFAVAVIAGLYAGNSATVTLTRSIVALILGAIAGQMAGWGAKMVLRDFLQKRKLEIDQEHIAAVTTMAPAPEEVVESNEPLMTQEAE
jgi:hypothetical protein